MTTTATIVERAAIAVAVAVIALLTLATIRPAYLAVTVPPTCGYVVEDGATVPAYCGDVAELDARLDALHAERSVGRFAPTLAPSDYAGRPAPAAYGPDRDPETADYAPGWAYADGAERAARGYGAEVGR